MQLGFTQAQLAKALGVAERAIQNYEQDHSAIQMRLLERLGGLGFDIVFLVFGNDRAQLDALDQALWDRVVAWANANCLDEKGQPLHEFARFQRISHVYRWLKNAGVSESEVEERLHRMSGARAA
jgi:transcriptional regulator with XRE-family HTH domain